VNDVVCVQLRSDTDVGYIYTRCDVDKRAWQDKWRQLRVLYERKDSQHCRAKIEENKSDMKKKTKSTPFVRLPLRCRSLA